MRSFTPFVLLFVFCSSFSQNTADIEEQAKKLKDSITLLKANHQVKIQRLTIQLKTLESQLKNNESLDKKSSNQLNDSTYFFRVGNKTRFFESPRSTSKQLFSIPTGTSLEFIEFSSDYWWNVRRGDIEGFIRYSDIDKTTINKYIKDSVAICKRNFSVKCYVKTIKQTNIYSKPIAKSATVTAVSKGTQLNIVKSTKDWLIVNYGNRELYVKAINVSVDRKFYFKLKKTSVVLSSYSDTEIIKNFSNDSVEIVDVKGYCFEILNTKGETGYINQNSIDDWQIVKRELNQEYIESKHRNGIPIIVKDVSVSNINSADGVDVTVEWEYIKKDKIAKYVEFSLLPYNRVGDIQTCRIRNTSRFTGQITGPVKSGEESNSYWGTAWYNNTISCIKLTKVRIIYTDGTQYTYVNELPKLYSMEFTNSCEYNE